MALPSPACGGSLPAPPRPQRSSLTSLTSPVGREKADGWRRAALTARVLCPLSCRGRSHLPSLSGDAAVTPCLCSGLHRDVFSAPRGQHPCSQPCQEETHPQLLAAVGRGGEERERGCGPTVQQALVGPVSPWWGHCGSHGHWGSAQASSGSIRRVPPVLPVPPDPPGWLLLGQAVPRGRGSCGSREGPCLWVPALPVCWGVSRVPLLPRAGHGAPEAGAATVHQPQDSWAPGRGKVLEGSWMSGEGTVLEGLWVPGESGGGGGFCWKRFLFLQWCGTNPAEQSRPHTRDAGQGLDGHPSGQEQEQRDVSAPPPSVPAQRVTDPAPALLPACHLSPHQPGCSSSEGLQRRWAEKEASDSRLREKKILPEQNLRWPGD